MEFNINININDGVVYKALDTMKEIAVVAAKQENFSVEKKAEVAQTQGVQQLVSFISSVITELIKTEKSKKGSVIMPWLLAMKPESPEKAEEKVEPTEQKADTQE